jgi:rhodanese-related sulfurtransferase
MRMLAAPWLLAASVALAAPPPNPEIDAGAFVRDVRAATELREARRIDEATFVRMMREPGTVVLDARSRAMYDRRHVAGAVSLSFPDFTAETLARAIPDRSTRVLIYCNNNFANDALAFPLKARPASLNLSTWVALYTYGYRNVYELGPYVDVSSTPIPLIPAPEARVTSRAAPAPSTRR